MREGGRRGERDRKAFLHLCPIVTVSDLWWHKKDTALESAASNQTLPSQIVGEVSIRTGGIATL